ncbi:MAG TPA: cupin domain-containing protein [Burkholderiaceae bacterium]|nr:cupin domain-containing protein [Burkholderiaceae bacterium]
MPLTPPPSAPKSKPKVVVSNKRANRSKPRIPVAAERAPAEPAGVEEGAPRIGVQLRHYRLMRKLRLSDLAALASCSESLLSRIENNQLNPSFTTLHRLCKALDISIANMMTPAEQTVCIVTRPGERPVVGRSNLRNPENSEAEVFIPYTDGRLLEGLLVTLRPGGTSNGVVSHRGEEVGYVLEGQFELTVEKDTYTIGPGGTFFFRSELPHSYRNPGTDTTRIVWINTPPSF